MFTLGIPNSQQRRANQVLKHDRSIPIEFDTHRQDDDFHIFTFDLDYDGFKDVVILLKNNGVTTIGADDQLTEPEIMKLTDLIEADITGMEPMGSKRPSKGFGEEKWYNSAEGMNDKLKSILDAWKTKEYNSPQERYEEYFMDIEELCDEIEDKKQSDTIDPDLPDMNENKIQLKDFFTTEQHVSTVPAAKPSSTDGITKAETDVEIPIQDVPDTRVHIVHKDSRSVDEALKNVTIKFTYGGANERPHVNIPTAGTFENVNFEPDADPIESHENEGYQWLFIAKAGEENAPVTWTVEVSVDAVDEGQGFEPDWNSIQDIHWDTLEVSGKAFDDHNQENLTWKDQPEDETIDEQGCTEQEIAEGTCGHTQTADGKKLNTPGGTKGMPADKRTTIIALETKIRNKIKKLK